MYGKIKHTIRKLIEGATLWYINEDHSMKVCEDLVEKKREEKIIIIIHTNLFVGCSNNYIYSYNFFSKILLKLFISK